MEFKLYYITYCMVAFFKLNLSNLLDKSQTKFYELIPPSPEVSLCFPLVIPMRC